jgi:hypothetical protein
MNKAILKKKKRKKDGFVAHQLQINVYLQQKLKRY